MDEQLKRKLLREAFTPMPTLSKLQGRLADKLRKRANKMRLAIIDDHGVPHTVIEDIDEFDLRKPLAVAHLIDSVNTGVEVAREEAGVKS